MPDNQIIHLAVLAKLNELSDQPIGSKSGRTITADDLRNKGFNLTAEQVHAGLAANFNNVAQRLGVEFFMALPAAALEQFVFMSILRNEDCAGLLKSLINSFMVTYMTAATAERAFTHLEGLEALRAQVAKSRNLTPMPMSMHPSEKIH